MEIVFLLLMMAGFLGVVIGFEIGRQRKVAANLAPLIPEIREKLMAARQAGAKGRTRLEDGWVMYSEEGSFAKAEAVARLDSLLGLLLDLAEVAELCSERK